MATFTKPATIPRWADDGLNTVEPNAAKKDLGWVFGEEPASSFENWKENLNGLWWKWVDERWDDGKTDDDIAVLDPSGTNADPIVEFNGTTALTSRFVFIDGATESELQFNKANQTMKWLTGVDQEFEVRPLRVIAGRSDADGINIFGVGTIKTIGFNGTSDALRYDTVNDRYRFGIGAVDVLTIDPVEAAFLTIPLRVGATTAHDSGDLSVQNGLNVGGAANPAAGHGIFTDAINVGDDSIPSAGVSRFLGTGGVNIGVVGVSNAGTLHAARGIKAGVGAGVAAVGDGIFGGGLVVGFDASPISEQVRVGDLNFGLAFNVSAPEVGFDTSDTFRYDRAANEFIFRIGGLDKVRVTASELHPHLAGVFDLGSAAEYWNTVNAERFVPRGAIATDPVVSRFERVHANGITCSAKVDGAANSVSGDWNIDTITHSSTGDWQIAPTENLSADGFVVATPQTVSLGHIATAAWVDLSDEVQIKMFLRTNGSDVDGFFGFAAFN